MVVSPIIHVSEQSSKSQGLSDGKLVQKGIPLHCSWKCKLGQLLWKSLCQFFKIKYRAAITFSNSISGYLFGGS